jgi:hypothetical protein
MGELSEFNQCLQTSNNNISQCSFFLDMLKQCQTSDNKSW